MTDRITLKEFRALSGTRQVARAKAGEGAGERLAANAARTTKTRQKPLNGEKAVLSFCVTLPVPPSLNNAYKNVKRGRVLTEEAKAYKEHAKGVIAKIADVAGFHCPADARLALSLRLYFSSKHRRDVSNCAKLPEDALSEVLGFDDCRVDRLLVERVGIDAKFPRCEILLEVIQ